MTSQFFEKMVQLMDKSIELENAQFILIQHCDMIGRNPEDLKPEDGGRLAAKLMSNLSNILSEGEWNDLDEAIKRLLKETVTSRSKIRGLVILGTQEYISLKQGKIALNDIRKKIDLPLNLVSGSWYPISLQEELLYAVNQVMQLKKENRSRAIGQYVMSPRVLSNGEHWFGRYQPTLLQAFMNINEILTLEGFKLYQEKGDFVLSFKCDVGEHFKAFLMGICDGIFSYKNINSYTYEFLKQHNGCTTIALSYGVTGKEGTE